MKTEKGNVVSTQVREPLCGTLNDMKMTISENEHGFKIVSIFRVIFTSNSIAPFLYFFK